MVALQIVAPLAVVAAACAIAMLPRAPEPFRLAPGIRIRREIPRGQTHVYHLAIPGGWIARVDVLQRDIDLSLGGGGMPEMDGSPYGTETILLSAAAAREFTVCVRADNRGSRRGSYELTIPEFRPSRPADSFGLGGQLSFAAAASFCEYLRLAPAAPTDDCGNRRLPDQLCVPPPVGANGIAR